LLDRGLESTSNQTGGSLTRCSGQHCALFQW
jgi:hypothetical protein